MAKPINYLDGARAEFEESFNWYAKQSEKAALAFHDAVKEALHDILVSPRQFPPTSDQCRYYQLKRFPFRIVFRNDPEQLVVVAVSHVKRKPGYWRDRI